MTNYSYFAIPLAKSVNHGLGSLSYIGSKLWDSIPYHMKDSNEFKHVKFKHLKLENLICVLMQALQNLFTKYWIFVVS